MSNDWNPTFAGASSGGAGVAAGGPRRRMNVRSLAIDPPSAHLAALRANPAGTAAAVPGTMVVVHFLLRGPH